MLITRRSLISVAIDVIVDGEKRDNIYGVDLKTREIIVPWIPDSDHINPIQWMLSDDYDLPEEAFNFEEAICIREAPEQVEVRFYPFGRNSKTYTDLATVEWKTGD